MEFGRPGQKVARFGLYEADVRQRVLTKGGLKVRLQDQPFQVLALLLERPGELVTREEIQQKLWPADTYVAFDDGLNTAIKKLRSALSDTADNPRFIETVPRRGYRFVAPITIVAAEPSPGLSANSDLQSTEASIRDTVAPRYTMPSASPRLNGERQHFLANKHYWIAAFLTLLLVGWIMYWLRPIHLRSAEGNARATKLIPRRSIAVLGFRNLPGHAEEDWMASAFAEMLNTELAAGGNLRMISAEDVAHARRDLQVQDTDTLAKQTLGKLRVTPGADVVVLGSCTPVDGKDQKRIRIDVRLQDTLTGEIISEDAFTGSQENLFEIATQAGTRLREKLGATPVSMEAAKEARASLPANEEATRLYAEGRAKLWNFESVAARDLLIKAEALDPNSAAIHLALADAWYALGYAATAQEEAKRAFDLSSALPREEQLYTEARYRELMRDWPKSAETYRALTKFSPDNLTYGLRLAAVLSADGKSQESLHVIEVLRQLPRSISDDPRIDMQEAQTCDHAANYRCSITAAANAATKAERRGSRLLLAEAKLWQSQAASRTDDPKGAMTLAEEAQVIFDKAGDKDGAARAAYRIADLLYRQGQFAQSNGVLEQTLRVFREVGDDRYAALALNDIAVGLRNMGEFAKARDMYEQALVGQRQIRNKRGVADTLNNLGALAWYQGNLPEAKRYYEEALDLYKELDAPDALAFVQLNIGNVLLDQGDLAGARNLLDLSLAAQHKLGNSSDIAEALHNLANVMGAQGDVEGAQKKYDEALAIRAGLGEQSNAAETRLGKAELMLASGDPTDSEPLARSALEEFAKEKNAEDELKARVALAQALAELGRLAEAKTALSHVAKPGNDEYPALVMKTNIVAAQLLAAQGQPGPAARKLRVTLREAHKTGFFVRQLEAMLALAEIEAKSGKKAEAHTLFQSVEKDARSKGFLLIARKAASERG
jgi:DNA-binding winged helix-turn-helix (wHTH) protein/tetratricopeptide (TPR) repeat protein